MSEQAWVQQERSAATLRDRLMQYLGCTEEDALEVVEAIQDLILDTINYEEELRCRLR